MAAMAVLGVFICLLVASIPVTFIGHVNEDESLRVVGFIAQVLGTLIGIAWFSVNGEQLMWK